MPLAWRGAGMIPQWRDFDPDLHRDLNKTKSLGFWEKSL
jgi:hypothetical protein